MLLRWKKNAKNHHRKFRAFFIRVFLYTLRKKQGAKAGKFQNGLTLTNRRKCFIMVSEHEVSRDSLSPEKSFDKKGNKNGF